MADVGRRLIGFVLIFGVILVIWSVVDWPEQTRPTSYDKGEYGGVEDQALDSETVDDLAHRTGKLQNSGR